MKNQVPSVAEQGWPASWVDKSQLTGLGVGDRFFNHALTRLPDGRLLTVYRHWVKPKQAGKDWTIDKSIADPKLPMPVGRLFLCTLGERVGPSQLLDLPSKTGMEHQEDPRLFWHQDRLWMSYVESYGYRGHWSCGMSLVRLVEREDGTWGWERRVPLSYGQNMLKKGREKNWSFFSSNNELRFVYSIRPHVVVTIDDKSGRVKGEHRTGGVTGWGHGTLSGGTPPLRLDDSFVTIFHSAEPHPTRVRRYNASAYRFEAKAPFRILECTRPFLFGSEADGWSSDARGRHYDPCVVFPGGAVPLEEDKLLLSVGVNDYSMAQVTVDLSQLQFECPRFPVVTRYFWTDLAMMPVVIDRRVAARWEKTEIVDDNWQGVMRARDPNIIKVLMTRRDVQEITKDRYLELKAAKAA